MLKVLLIFFILSFASLQAAPIIIGTDLQTQDILKGAGLYIDSEGNKSVDEVLEEPSLFSTFGSEKVELGFTTDQVWIKFAIKNSSPLQLHPLLELDNPQLDHIQLYKVDGTQIISHESTGLLESYDFEGMLNFNFHLTLKPESTQHYLLHVSTTGSALYFKASVMRQETLIYQEIRHQLVRALYLGLIIGLIIYNLFIYFFTRDINYLYYVAYHTSMVLIYSSLTTITKHIFSPWVMTVDAFMGLYYFIGAMVFMLLFTRSILKLQQFKWIDAGIKMFLLIDLILVILIMTCCYPIHATITSALLGSLYLISVCFYLKYKDHQYATYIVLGWSVSLIGSISLVLYQIGWAPYLDSVPYLYESTVIFEAILFSIVLARRINHTEELAKALATQKVLIKELHHRVKNNMQLIISLYRLKFSYVKNNAISTRLLENENNIIAMSTIHEVLYAQDAFDRLDTRVYFQKLIGLLQTSLTEKGISIIFKRSVDLPAQQAIYCGIILNELVTNAMKYAFDEGQEGKIVIALYEKKNKVIFKIKDDGKGYDQNKKTKSFGLTLVKALAEGELHAKVKIKSDDGTSYRMTWDKS